MPGAIRVGTIDRTNRDIRFRAKGWDMEIIQYRDSKDAHGAHLYQAFYPEIGKNSRRYRADNWAVAVLEGARRRRLAEIALNKQQGKARRKKALANISICMV